jgi:hydroxymethylpyrimidine pyrophosphatase-like HAD family hydrolase
MEDSDEVAAVNSLTHLRPMPLLTMTVETAKGIKLLASDIDGTVTTNGRLTIDVLQRFQELQDNDVSVVLVTGRPAGWAAALAQYLPGVKAVLSENGAVLSVPNMEMPPIQLDRFTDDELTARRLRVFECLAVIKKVYPQIKMGAENGFRLTDVTFEVSPSIDPGQVGEIARTAGVRHTFSSVHHHLSLSDLDKRTGLMRAIDLIAPDIAGDLTTVAVTLGDSVNDAPLFEQGWFAATVGVSVIQKSLELLSGACPDYVTQSDASGGFLELAMFLLRSRSM